MIQGGETHALLWEQLLALLVALPLFRMLRQLLGACTSSGALALFRMMRQVMRALGTHGHNDERFMYFAEESCTIVVEITLSQTFRSIHSSCTRIKYKSRKQETRKRSMKKKERKHSITLVAATALASLRTAKHLLTLNDRSAHR